MNQTYKTLLALGAITLVLTIAVHIYLLQPRLKRNGDLVNNNKKAEEDLWSRNKTWKLDPEYFRKLKTQYERIRNKRLKGLDRVFLRANGEFKNLIDPTKYGQTVKQWRDGLFVMSFGEAYYNTMNAMKGLNVHLDEKVFGMSADQVVRKSQVYRKLAHLYVAKEAATLARRSNLTLTHTQMTADWCEETSAKNEFERMPAMVMLKPIRSFFVEGEKEAFLEEFPVELRVRGKLSDLTKFITALTLGKRFLPIDRITIRAIGAENYVKSIQFAKKGTENLVEARITLSGFLVHNDVDSLAKIRLKIDNKKPARPGA